MGLNISDKVCRLLTRIVALQLANADYRADRVLVDKIAARAETYEQWLLRD